MTAFEIARYGLIIETGRVGLRGTTQMLADDPASAKPISACE